jgi:hypothetical protein
MLANSNAGLPVSAGVAVGKYGIGDICYNYFAS